MNNHEYAAAGKQALAAVPQKGLDFSWGEVVKAFLGDYKRNSGVPFPIRHIALLKVAVRETSLARPRPCSLHGNI